VRSCIIRGSLALCALVLLATATIALAIVISALTGKDDPRIPASATEGLTTLYEQECARSRPDPNCTVLVYGTSKGASDAISDLEAALKEMGWARYGPGGKNGQILYRLKAMTPEEYEEGRFEGFSVFEVDMVRPYPVIVVAWLFRYRGG